MSPNKVLIVPVHLELTLIKPSTDYSPLKPISVIQTNQLKFSSSKNYVVQTVMQKLLKNDL